MTYQIFISSDDSLSTLIIICVIDRFLFKIKQWKLDLFQIYQKLNKLETEYKHASEKLNESIQSIIFTTGEIIKFI